MERAKTIIHFVRHGEVENPSHIRYGRLHGYHLSAMGRKQAEQSGQYFLHRPIKHIYSSPLERAQQTASLLGLALPYVPISLDARLLEIKTPPKYEGHTRNLDFHYPFDASPEAETEAQVVQRLRSFIEERVAQHAGQEIIAVSHGDPIALLINASLYKTYDPQGDPYPAFASVTSFVFEGWALSTMWHHAFTDTGSVRS